MRNIKGYLKWQAFGFKLGFFVKSPMSEEQTMAFRQAAETDANLREKIKSATQLKAVWVHDGDVDTQKEADAVVAIAKEAGFTITVEEALQSF